MSRLSNDLLNRKPNRLLFSMQVQEIKALLDTISSDESLDPLIESARVKLACTLQGYIDGESKPRSTVTKIFNVPGAPKFRRGGFNSYIQRCLTRANQSKSSEKGPEK